MSTMTDFTQTPEFIDAVNAAVQANLNEKFDEAVAVAVRRELANSSAKRANPWLRNTLFTVIGASVAGGALVAIYTIQNLQSNLKIAKQDLNQAQENNKIDANTQLTTHAQEIVQYKKDLSDQKKTNVSIITNLNRLKIEQTKQMVYAPADAVPVQATAFTRWQQAANLFGKTHPSFNGFKISAVFTRKLPSADKKANLWQDFIALSKGKSTIVLHVIRKGGDPKKSMNIIQARVVENKQVGVITVPQQYAVQIKDGKFAVTNNGYFLANKIDNNTGLPDSKNVYVFSRTPKGLPKVKWAGAAKPFLPENLFQSEIIKTTLPVKALQPVVLPVNPFNYPVFKTEIIKPKTPVTPQPVPSPASNRVDLPKLLKEQKTDATQPPRVTDLTGPRKRNATRIIQPASQHQTALNGYQQAPKTEFDAWTKALSQYALNI